jgi:hypothetical protein
MKISDRPASRRTRTPLARALACALLIGIIYAVTFGSVHSHLNVSSKLDTNNRPASAAGQAISSITAPLHGNSNRYECLVCLFHQQLFNSIVNAPLLIVKSATQVPSVSVPTIFYYSNPIASGPIARLSGRAPPAA